MVVAHNILVAVRNLVVVDIGLVVGIGLVGIADMVAVDRVAVDRVVVGKVVGRGIGDIVGRLLGGLWGLSRLEVRLWEPRICRTLLL